MVKKGLVSIIVPVYNTDPILMKKCIASVLNQSYKNIELLIINDGSIRKETLSFLEGLKDEKIAIFNKKNEGVSSARNLGLKKAQGEYLFFLDSDDYIKNNTIEKMMEKAVDGLYDAIIAKMITVIGGKLYNSVNIMNGEIRLDKSFDLILSTTVLFASQGILMKSKIAKKYSFDTGLRYGEDLLYGIKVLSSSVTYYMNEAVYYYVHNNQSATLHYDANNSERYLKDFNHLYRLLINNYPEKQDMIRFMMCDKINLILNRYCSAKNPSFFNYRKIARSYRRFLLSAQIHKTALSFHRRFFVYAFCRRLYLLHYVAMRIKCVIRKKHYVNHGE